MMMNHVSCRQHAMRRKVGHRQRLRHSMSLLK
jgi:hypothetical protein